MNRQNMNTSIITSSRYWYQLILTNYVESEIKDKLAAIEAVLKNELRSCDIDCLYHYETYFVDKKTPFIVFTIISDKELYPEHEVLIRQNADKNATVTYSMTGNRFL